MGIRGNPNRNLWTGSAGAEANIPKLRFLKVRFRLDSSKSDRVLPALSRTHLQCMCSCLWPMRKSLVSAGGCFVAVFAEEVLTATVLISC